MRAPEWLRETGDAAELASKAVEYLFTKDYEMLEKVLAELAERDPVTYAKLYPLFRYMAGDEAFRMYEKIYIEADVESRALSEAGVAGEIVVRVSERGGLYDVIHEARGENYILKLLEYDTVEKVAKLREANVSDEELYRVLSNDSWMYMEAILDRETGATIPLMVACKDEVACRMAASILRDIEGSSRASVTDIAKWVMAKVRRSIGEEKPVEVAVRTSHDFTTTDVIAVRVPLWYG